jgi:hypothetical protein
VSCLQHVITPPDLQEATLDFYLDLPGAILDTARYCLNEGFSHKTLSSTEYGI